MADIPIKDLHFRPLQRAEKSPLTGNIYRWEQRSPSLLAICMVEERDVAFILAVKKGCCGYRARYYRRATPEEYEKWRIEPPGHIAGT